MKKRIVIKLGTSSITQSDGSLDVGLLESIAANITELREMYDVLLVSSGAVATGKRFLRNYTESIPDKKAAAAIGNPILINTYSDLFKKHKYTVAQCLCERHTFSDRATFLQLKETVKTLWKSGVLPICNENDVVSSLELRFSDNDELATQMAIAFDVELLLIGTSVDGLLDEENKTIREVKDVSEVLHYAKKEKSTDGLGGMTSKLTFAKLATNLGIETIIFNAKKPGNINKALRKETGTRFFPKESNLTARQKWLASGSLVTGRLMIDEETEKALVNQKTLWSVGVKEVSRAFKAGEVFEIVNEKEEIIALAKAKIDSQGIVSVDSVEVAEAGEWVIL